MSVREAQQRVSASEFAEWLAYYKMQPFGYRRLDEHNAWLCYWTHTSMCDSNMKPEDFLMNSDGNKASTVDEKMNILQTVASFANRKE